MMNPGELLRWMKEKRADRERLQTALRRRGMQPYEWYKLRYDPEFRIYRFRYYNKEQGRWI